MPTIRFGVFLLVAVIGLGPGSRPSLAQDPAKKDEALEKLLEKLEEPKSKPDATAEPAKKAESKPARGEPAKRDKDDALEKLLDNLEGPKPNEPGKADEKKAAGEVGSKDQSLDKLLEGLGGLDDKPSPDDKKQGGGGGTPPSDPPPPAPGGGETKPNPLDDASKKLDELLEEKTGRKPKKKPKQGQGQGQGQKGEGEDGDGGPLGDLVKQMRDVENRLDEPDTGAETRRKQTEIVKNLDTLLEQMRNSSSRSQAMKLVRGGPKPGGPPQPGQGNQPGATGQGVGLSKPTPPKTPPAAVELVKEVWGQLPAQFRDDMANVLNEKALPAKAEMIRLYYLSLGKKSVSKGD